MISKLNKSRMCFCYGKLIDNNTYDDSYILGLDIACHYCTIDSCNYYDEKGSDNRRCFRYLSNTTHFDCILYCGMDTNTESRKRDLLYHSRSI